MARDPIPYHSRELAKLECEAAIRPWCNSKRVLVQANIGAVIGWIEPAVEPRLREEIELGPELRVHEQRETIIKKVVDI